MERLEAARLSGFSAIEFSDPLSCGSVEDIRKAMDATGLEAVQFTTSSFTDPGRKQIGVAAIPGREVEFRADCDAILPYVQGLHVNWVHVKAGIIDSQDHKICYRTYLDNIIYAIEKFEPFGVGVLLEPINNADFPGYFLRNISMAQRTLRDLGSARAKIMFDTYHVARDGLDPCRAFEQAGDHVAHIQIADCPGRHEPLSGRIDFRNFFRTIEKTNYQGWVSCEYLPTSGSLNSLAWLNQLAVSPISSQTDK